MITIKIKPSSFKFLKCAEISSFSAYHSFCKSPSTFIIVIIIMHTSLFIRSSWMDFMSGYATNQSRNNTRSLFRDFILSLLSNNLSLFRMKTPALWKGFVLSKNSRILHTYIAMNISFLQIFNFFYSLSLSISWFLVCRGNVLNIVSNLPVE